MGRRSHRPPIRGSSNVPLVPDELRTRLAAVLGDELPALEIALGAASPTSIRLNALKPFPVNATPVPWCANGRYLDERPAFTFDPLLHAGAYYVQEASSMLLERALIAAGVLDRDLLALDLCAAPGGKSTHLLSLFTKGSLLVANEPDAARRHILAENIWKHGASNAVITGSDPKDLSALPSCFDLILVDAPCSGEGMFRKDPFARQQWSPALVASCAATQRRILSHAWEALAPGGTLIYSTCTWELTENEEQLQPLLAQGGSCLELTLDPNWGVVRYDVGGVIGHRCYPHKVKGEGFFLAAVRKPGERLTRPQGSATAEGSREAHWLDTGSNAVIAEHREVLYASPAAWSQQVNEIGRAMRLHAPGTPFAERKGDEWTPHAAAALSRWLERSAFRELALTLEQTLSYLRGEALPAANASGTALVTYRGFALGWVNGANTRWNNRWPAPWRIRGQRSNGPDVPWSERRPTGT